MSTWYQTIIAVGLAALIGVGLFVEPPAPRTQQPIVSFPNTYTSPKLGYSIGYPDGWIMDDSQSDGPADILKHPQREAFITLQRLLDPRAATPEGRTAITADLEKGFNNTLGFRLETIQPATWNGRPALLAVGEDTDKNNRRWSFRQRTIFFDSGTIVNVTENIRRGSLDQLDATVRAIMSSLALTNP